MSYIAHTPEEVAAMLARIGVEDIEELFSSIPPALRLKSPVNLGESQSEWEVESHLRDLAAANTIPRLSFLGAGNYDHVISKAVDYLVSRSEFSTAYTPYQPEISQGTLQAIFEFQTAICRVLHMDVANASMYDGATAAAEATLMARRVTRRTRILASQTLHPEYLDVVRTYLNANDQGCADLVTIPADATGRIDQAALEAALDESVAAVVVGYPNFYGIAERVDRLADLAHRHGALLITSTLDPYAFGVLQPPGALGADIATAEGQALGMPPSYGGPGLGLFAIRNDRALIRQLPGRLVGRTTDRQGRTGYVLTLATREQHIRREKATSNICSNHGLCALATVIQLSILGQAGFAAVARASLAARTYFCGRIRTIDGFSLPFSAPGFNEVIVSTTGVPAATLLDRLAHEGILAGVPLDRFGGPPTQFCLAFTEKHTKKDIDTLVDALDQARRACAA